LIMSGELLSSIMNELGFTEDTLDKGSGANMGRILIGTVQSDVHDIGKNIVRGLLVSEGYNVKDIGVDVPIDKFVKEVKEYDPQVVAMSGLLTIAYDSMKNTIEAFKIANIRDNFKVIIGGGAIDKKVAEYAGADAFGASAVDGVMKIKEMLANSK